jgi:hypothetical protein
MKAGANGLLSFQLATARSWPTSDILQNNDWLEHVPMCIPIQKQKIDETTKLSGYPFSWLTQICADLGDFRPPDMVDFTGKHDFVASNNLYISPQPQTIGFETTNMDMSKQRRHMCLFTKRNSGFDKSVTFW